jgi:hypothetical protein
MYVGVSTLDTECIEPIILLSSIYAFAGHMVWFLPRWGPDIQNTVTLGLGPLSDALAHIPFYAAIKLSPTTKSVTYVPLPLLYVNVFADTNADSCARNKPVPTLSGAISGVSTSSWCSRMTDLSQAPSVTFTYPLELLRVRMAFHTIHNSTSGCPQRPC